MANKTRKSKGDYIIAIPSYKRQETLKEKTLAMLQHYKIPASKIFIFVADKEEEENYRSALDAKSYNKIIVGIKGLAPVRNFIAGYFPIGKKIVFSDDDIKGFLEFDESKPRHEKPLVSLDKIIQRGFQECGKHGCRFWGMYPVANGFFMKDTVSTDLKFCVGSFFGLINPGTKQLTIPVSEKEDYYRTLRMYELDGCVVRLNFVAPKTAYYKEAGGMQTDPERKEKQEKAVEFLLKTFPDWVKRNPNRKSGFPEIRIKDSTKRT
jgi:cellulose synthase/poly-beta-1,6-N-acetylglucosamine synthase-like glycosyltransferase